VAVGDQVSKSAAVPLADAIKTRSAHVAVIGMGYVGLPLAISIVNAGYRTLGLEVNPERLRALENGRSYVDDLSDEALRPAIVNQRLTVSDQVSRLSGADIVMICLPTPLGVGREPDLAKLINVFDDLGRLLRPGQLIVLCSTTYPGTTEELALPRLQGSGLTVGEDFFLAFAPERVDPGNLRYKGGLLPRVVGGVTKSCAALAEAFLKTIHSEVLVVSSCRAAEMTKLLENSFRSVNIALVNEMAIICRKLGLDVWEVIDAASTKPFGFMRFEPGPGLGGHCIPIDPLYLSWKLRVLNYRTRFVELADDINRAMPDYVATLVASALNDRGITIKGSKILALGIAYKRDVSDARESPALEVIASLRDRGAIVQAHDPLVQPGAGSSVEFIKEALSPKFVGSQDCIVVLTDHSWYDWDLIFRSARLVVDTRGVSHRIGYDSPNVLRL
jgi:UDP-N-acetyl-D-glucosamine dehydrogenase